MSKDMYTCERIRLRALNKEDIHFITSNYNDPDIKSTVYEGAPFPLTYEDEFKFIQSQSGAGVVNDYSFAIELINTAQIIGACGYNIINWKNRSCELGIWLDKTHWNQGYGAEALQILIDFAFDELNLHRIQLSYYSLNERARRCYDKLGFKQEGVLKDYIYRNGKYHDKVIMSIIRQYKND